MTVVQADPYPWPWHGQLETDRLAVVVAGAQRYWMTRTIDPAGALAALAMLTTPLRARGVPIVWVRHGQAVDATGRRPGSVPVRTSEDWQLVCEPPAEDHIVDASGHDGCYGSPLDSLLRLSRRDHLLLCGLGLEGPVHSTLRSLNDRGFECLTVVDACSSYEASIRTAAVSTIVLSFGIFGAVATARAVADGLGLEVER